MSADATGCLIDRPKRSAWAFAFGGWYGVCTFWTPAPQHPILVPQIREGIALSTIQRAGKSEEE
jgi:hypothetical protein